MIHEYLSFGQENARTGKEICNLLGITSRELRRIVEIERRQGKPICASTTAPAGYFLAANRQELERYCRSLFRRAGEIHKTRKACLRSLETLPNGGATNGEHESSQQ